MLFENEWGDGDLLSAEEIGKLIRKYIHRIELVFVAACDSKIVGEIFQKNNVKHVVCVEKNRFVADTAAIEFTKNFYDCLFQGESICLAFDKAYDSVRFKQGENEANLFVNLKQEKHRKSECVSLPKFEEGKWECRSDHIKIKLIHQKIENFKFRESQMSDILSNLLDKKKRIVSLVGLDGVGKSALARSILHYAAERKYFTGGIMMLQLKSVRSTFNMVKLFKEAIISFLQLTEEDRKEIS